VPESSQEDLVSLLATHDSIEAATVRSLLEANGILCIVQGEQHRAMLTDLAAYIEVHVLVPRGKLEEARALLEARVEPDAPGQGESAEDGETEEPASESTTEEDERYRAGKRRRRKVVIWLLIFWLFIGPAMALLGMEILGR
jgi:hypothetical protein